MQDKQTALANKISTHIEDIVRLAEILMMAHAITGEPAGNFTKIAMMKTQKKMRETQERLVTELDTGLITPESYLRKFNNLVAKTMNKNRVILGDDVFVEIFGDLGPRPKLIDRKTFLGQFREELRP